jgi:hypothetical protein
MSPSDPPLLEIVVPAATLSKSKVADGAGSAETAAKNKTGSVNGVAEAVGIPTNVRRPTSNAVLE